MIKFFPKQLVQLRVLYIVSKAAGRFSGSRIGGAWGVVSRCGLPLWSLPGPKSVARSWSPLVVSPWSPESVARGLPLWSPVVVSVVWSPVVVSDDDDDDDGQ